METKNKNETRQPNGDSAGSGSSTSPAMERLILCPASYERFAAGEADADHYIAKAGTALFPMCCGYCRRPLRPGDRAYAVSVFMDENAYSPWEDECLGGVELETTTL